MTVPPRPRLKRALAIRLKRAWAIRLKRVCATRLKRVWANEANPTFSPCDSGNPYRLSNGQQQGDDCPVAEHEDRDQGRGDSRGARQSHGELPALSRRNARIGADSRSDASPCRPEDREGVRVPHWPGGNPALTQSLSQRERARSSLSL